jgi:hypothetical protein
MKLFVALLFTLATVQNQAPVNAAEDLPPNLRGVAGIALTNGESRYGTPPVDCKAVDRWCSTSSAIAALTCCAGLTCRSDDSVSIHDDTINGVCEGEGNTTAPSNTRDGAGCKRESHNCSTKSDAPAQDTCCNSEDFDLFCKKDYNITDPKFDGECNTSSGDVCLDFNEMKVECDDDSNSTKTNVTKCTSHPDFDTNCGVTCTPHQDVGHICSSWNATITDAWEIKV